jgi:uncharacterized protein
MSSWFEVGGYTIGILAVVGGVLGSVYPILPGAPLAFGGLWLIAWLGRYERVGTIVLVVLGAIAGLSLVVDAALGALGARRARASRLAILGSALGSLLGLTLGLPGVILGPFVLALLGEYWSTRNLVRAGEVAWATWIGTMLGMVAKVALTWAMIGIFAVAWFF